MLDSFIEYSMLSIRSQVSLLPYNSFALSVKAAYYAEINQIEDLQTLAATSIFTEQRRLLLGGGSNVLFLKDFEGLVLKIQLKGIEIIQEDAHEVLVRVGAGENWHQFVLFCISKDWAGVENLSLIPGTVGAAPMQNIGAYGVELQEVFDSLQAWHLEEHQFYTFDKASCRFGYRESVFKHKYKDKFLITDVTFRLSKVPRFNVSYGALQETLRAQGVEQLSLKAVSDAVVAIRSSKLPNPAEIGNAGSFFKNPTITQAHLEALRQTYPQLPSYPAAEGSAKVPAAWLIEQCGWKGKRIGDIGVHPKQALVLVNYGQGSGQAIADLAQEIAESVWKRFEIRLVPEVNFID